MKRINEILLCMLIGMFLNSLCVQAGITTPADNLKVAVRHPSFGGPSPQRVFAPALQLLDDNSLLPSTHMKEKLTNARANELMQQSRPGESSTGIRFQENKGQIVDTDGKVRNDIAFIANASSARLYFRNDGISYVFTKIAIDADSHLKDMSLRAEREVSPYNNEISHPDESGIRNDKHWSYSLGSSL